MNKKVAVVTEYIFYMKFRKLLGCVHIAMHFWKYYTCRHVKIIFDLYSHTVLRLKLVYALQHTHFENYFAL